MSETTNISQVANKVANDIFKVFFWEVFAQNDVNFECVLDTHTSDNGTPKATHPGDVLFYYLDPYINKKVFLHTDLKSYKKSSLTIKKVRAALQSLAMTVECAHISPGWAKKYPVDGHPFVIRGLLFVVNHDGKEMSKFGNMLNSISKTNLTIAKNQVLHVMGPPQISSLYAIAVDIKLMISDKQLSANYRFFYPDLTLWKRHTPDDQRIGATIEMLMSPYFILRHTAVKDDIGNEIERAGSIVYYSRPCETVDEFVYLIDCLSRYQLVNTREQIRIRAYHSARSSDMKSNFDKAKIRYCQMWSFEGDREKEILSISIDGIQRAVPNYIPDEIGWHE